MALKFLQLSLLAVIAVKMVLAEETPNCFYSGDMPYLTKAYNLPDYSGNFTVVTDYWMRLSSECEFTVDTNTKLTWYSSDITVKTQVSYDEGDSSGCRAPNPALTDYESGTMFILED